MSWIRIVSISMRTFRLSQTLGLTLHGADESGSGRNATIVGPFQRWMKQD